MNTTLKNKVRAASPRINNPTLDSKVRGNQEKATQELALLQKSLTSLGELSYDPTDLDQSQADYESFDKLLGTVQNKRKWWAGLIEPAIRPIREGLDALYKLNREIDRPMEALEAAVKQAMKRFKQQEVDHIRMVEEAKARESQRLLMEAQELERRKEAAKTHQMKGILDKKRQEKLEEAGDIEEQETPAPVQANASRTRTRMVWKITAFAHLIEAVSQGKVPMEVLMVDQIWLNRYFRDHPEHVMEFPGVTVEEEIIIAGR